MKSCVYCKRRYKKNSETSFHRFPKDLEDRKVWLQNMKITNWTPKINDSLCSLHFANECFDKHFTRTILKPGSFPTIFEGISTFPSSPRPLTSMSSPHPSTSTSLPSPLMTKSASIAAKRKILCDANITELSDNTKKDQEPVKPSTPKTAIIEFGLLHDHRYVITPRSSKEVALKLSKANFKALSQRVRRLKLKLANMKTVINDLIKKGQESEECIQMLKQYETNKWNFLIECLKTRGTKKNLSGVKGHPDETK